MNYGNVGTRFVSGNDNRDPAFEATFAALALTADSISLDVTHVPDEVPAWTSFRGSGPLPSMSVRFSSAPRTDDTELVLLELLGEGGMGQVHRATQRSLGREVAVKTIRAPASPRAIASLCDEAVVTGRLSHPNVIPVHALGEAEDGRPMLVMKRVDGVGWNVLLGAADHAYWTRNEVATEDRLHVHLEVLRKITHAVAFAHSHGIVHRDIKPENVMIGDFGEVYLVDWGIAVKAGTSTEGKLAGTPYYLAPEMVGGVVDVRTDVYLLGATLCEILTGGPPHHGGSLKEVLHRAFISEPPAFPADAADELVALCKRALACDPQARPQTAGAFGDALDDHVRHRGSRTLARTGEERLGQLRHAIESASPASRDLAELRRLIAECRFAFQEARRAWIENPMVAPGLFACLRLAVRAELDRRDGEAARAMLRELEPPDPDLAREVGELDIALAREADERARVAQLAHDLDPEREGGVRVVAAASVFAISMAVSIYVSTFDRITPTLVFEIGLALLVGLGGLLAALWRQLGRTVFNRRLALWACISALTVVAHRGVALFDPSATAAGILTNDLVILAGFWICGSVFLFRWMALVGLALLLSTVVILALPSMAGLLFSGVNMLACTSFLVRWRLTPAAGHPRSAA